MSIHNKIIFGDNLLYLKGMKDESVDLIYIDPPFNTGKKQSRTQLKVERSINGSRVGFNGVRYKEITVDTKQYPDSFDNYISEFIQPRLIEAYRILKKDGSLYFHIDYREVHYCKILLDMIFGRQCFINEIIWAYDYGGKPKTRWPAKHDNILFYVKDPNSYTFNVNDIDRIPYMAPELVGEEKAQRGKLPTDTWWHTIVATNSKEKTGYPTQKPKKILERIIRASSDRGDLVLDFFAGSGTTGAVCLELDRRFILIDSNEEAIHIMEKRFAEEKSILWEVENLSINSSSQK